MQFYRSLLSVGVLAAIALLGCKSPTSTTTTPTPAAAPAVSSVSPLKNATTVALNKKLLVVFSESMDATTLTTSSFLVTYPTGTPVAATAVAGSVATTENSVTFTPAADLVANTVYTATVTTAAKSLAGTALAENLVWSFTSGAGDDTTAPTITTVIPAAGDTGVAVASNVTATFSEATDLATVKTSFTLKTGATTVAGEFSTNGYSVVFNPSADLAYATTYTATITTDAKDLAGNALVTTKTWTFATTATPDTTAPTVASVTPLDAANGIALATNVTAVFSEAVNADTLTATTFTLKAGATSIPGAVTLGVDEKTVTLNPTADLANGTTYTATITTGAKDLAGNALAVAKTWTFTTVAATTTALDVVDLKTAANYVILAKSGVSNGSSSVTGDIGVSPADHTYLTQFSEVLDSGGAFSIATGINGKLYAADYSGGTTIADLTTAISDVEAAYTDAAGRANPTSTELGNGSIGGKSLVAGLYKWTNSVNIATDLTLSGSASDVWIFQISGDLTIASATKIVLSGGALAKNIFWQVAGSATLGSTSTWQGTILGKTLIAVETSAVVHGRLLAQTAVTLDGATVTVN